MYKFNYDMKFFTSILTQYHEKTVQKIVVMAFLNLELS
jgi:hypothetical protein